MIQLVHRQQAHFFFLILDYSNAFANIQMKPIVRNGITYFDLEKVSWTFTPTKLHIHLDNLFNGDKVLGMLIFTRNFICIQRFIMIGWTNNFIQTFKFEN